MPLESLFTLLAVATIALAPAADLAAPQSKNWSDRFAQLDALTDKPLGPPQLEEARRICRELLADAPSASADALAVVQLMNMHGIICYRLGDYEEALRQFRAAQVGLSRIHPRHSQLMESISGNVKEAERELGLDLWKQLDPRELLKMLPAAVASLVVGIPLRLLLVSTCLAALARRRGYEWIPWLLVTAIADVFMLVVLLAALPDRRLEQRREQRIESLKRRLAGLSSPQPAVKPLADQPLSGFSLGDFQTKS